MNEVEERLRELKALLQRIRARTVDNRDLQVVGGIVEWFIGTMIHADQKMRGEIDAPAVGVAVCAGCNTVGELARSRHLDGQWRCATCNVRRLDDLISSLRSELKARDVPEWVIELNEGRPRGVLRQ